MIDVKKKYWREKVTAEITLAHLQQFAEELGTRMTAAEAAAFLNDHGRAQGIWMHMMRAGEEYIQANLATQKIRIAAAKPTSAQRALVHQ
jgi:hypothetical protein